MNPSSHLVDALKQEQSVFKKFSCWRQLSETLTAFHATNTDLVPHWNLVYPSEISHHYSAEDISSIREFYSNVGRVPHVMMLPGKNEHPVERCAYFILDRHVSEGEFHEFDSDNDSVFLARNADNLNDFASVIGDVFELDAFTRNFFSEKMAKMKDEDGSRFWIVYSGMIPIGTASVFLTSNGGHFLFNVAIDKQVQQRGLGKKMLASVIRECRRPLYTYSHNPAMIESVLPALGFINIGSTIVVPLDRLP